MQIPFPAEPQIDMWGNPEGQTLLFLHANSYSSRMYHPFLEPLAKDHHIWSPDLPGHGESRWNGRVHSWEDLADYYIQLIEKSSLPQPMTIMGHSIGGIIALFIAVKRPSWVNKIILLDPVLLPKRILFVMRILKLFSLTHLIPLARASIRRRSRFTNKSEALEHYARKSVFSQLEPRFLEAYVETCLRETDQGTFQLSCAPQLESSIYQSIPVKVWSLPKKVLVEALFIIGENSDTVSHRGIKRLKRSKRNHIVKSVEAGHLFPFEKPDTSIALIKDYLAK